MGKTKAFHLRIDGTNMICRSFGSKSTEAVFIFLDFFPEGKNINNRRKWQALPKVLKAEGHESFYSRIEIESEKSDNEVSDEDLVLDRENANSQ